MQNMKEKIKYLFLIVVLGTLVFGCSNSMTDFSEYLQYLANEENGVVKEKTISGLKLQVKYLPLEYLNHRAKEEGGSNYDHSVCFMFTLGPDSTESFDITKVGVSNYEEFAERMETMNFRMHESLELKVNNKIYKPSIAQMENVYGLKNGRIIMVVYEVKDNKDNNFMRTQDVQFIYKDQLFNTGITKFLFEENDLTDLPKFINDNESN